MPLFTINTRVKSRNEKKLEESKEDNLGGQVLAGRKEISTFSVWGFFVQVKEKTKLWVRGGAGRGGGEFMIKFKLERRKNLT